MSAPWMKFFPSDWRADPALRMCSIGARGLWMEMLCVMHEATPRGALVINGKALGTRQIAALAGCTLDEAEAMIAELEEAGVFSRESDGTIISRRMQRDAEKEARDKANGGKGGHPDIRRGTVPKEDRVRRFRRSDSPAKARRIFDKSNGRCHWCAKPLSYDNHHIDHLIAVRDGGTNDEGNLVAACADCNGERAMSSGRSDSDLMVGRQTDHKAQKPEARSQIPEEGTDVPSAAEASVERDQAPPRKAESGQGRIDLEEVNCWVSGLVGTNPVAVNPDISPIVALIRAGYSRERIEIGVRAAVAAAKQPIRSWKSFDGWVRNTAADAAPIAKPIDRETEWRNKLKRWTEKGDWPPMWGDPPGHPCCSIPAAVIAAFKADPARKDAA
ncbi:HNH endonuclease [Bosea sp. NPDC055594]